MRGMSYGADSGQLLEVGVKPRVGWQHTRSVTKLLKMQITNNEGDATESATESDGESYEDSQESLLEHVSELDEDIENMKKQHNAVQKKVNA